MISNTGQIPIIKKMIKAQNRDRYAKLFFCIISLIWLSVVWETESYLANYVIVAIVSVAIASKLPWNSGKSDILTIIFGVILSGFVCAAEYKLITPLHQHVIKAFALFCSGFCVFSPFLSIEWPCNNTKPFRIKNKWFVFVVPLLLICITYLSAWWGCLYPACMTNDSVSSVRQILTGDYSNHHPFYYTMLIKICIWIGSLFSNSITHQIAVYSVFSILFMSLIWSFSIMTMYEAEVQLKWILITLLIAILCPYHIIYASTMWKDVLFSGGVLLFVVCIYRIKENIGVKAINYILYVASSLVFGLWRSNGLVALFAFSIILLFLVRKENRRIIVIGFTVVIVCFIAKHPVLDHLNVKQPDSVEFLSIPIQQVSRVVNEGAELSDQEMDVISSIVEIKSIKEEYLPYVSDPIKNAIREQGALYLDEHLGEFLETWLSIGVKYPKLYIEAWIDQTKGYWNSGYDFWRYYLSVTDNELGIVQIIHSDRINNLFHEWRSFLLSFPLFTPLFSIGLHVWMIIIFLSWDIRRKSADVLILLPSILLVLTLLITTPIAYEFRYAYAVLLTMPFIIGIHVFSSRSKVEDNQFNSVSKVTRRHVNA